MSEGLKFLLDATWAGAEKKFKKQIADLESKIAEEKECSLKASAKHNLEMQNAQICIKELEAKLAEKEQEINDICQNYDFQINDFSREVYRLQKREKILEQQLAEKEKELEQYKNNWYIDIDSLKINENVQKIANQKVICELEKVKEWLEPKYFDYEQINYLTKIIDNQIAELKKGVE